jgi:hypothetical protein
MEVHQQDMRCAGAREYIDVGVSVMKANETYGMSHFPACSSYSFIRSLHESNRALYC